MACNIFSIMIFKHIPEFQWTFVNISWKYIFIFVQQLKLAGKIDYNSDWNYDKVYRNSNKHYTSGEGASKLPGWGRSYVTGQTEFSCLQFPNGLQHTQDPTEASGHHSVHIFRVYAQYVGSAKTCVWQWDDIMDRLLYNIFITHTEYSPHSAKREST